MKRLNLLGLAIMAIFALGAMTTTVASAETDGQPAILVLPETEKVTELKYTGSQDGTSKLETLSKKSIICLKSETTASEFLELEGKKADTNLAHNGLINFKECKEGKLPCRSENSAGEKDPVETILTALDLHMADETSTGGVLEPLLISKVKPASGTGNLVFNCGTLKDEVKGKVGCLILPGLKEVETTEKVEILCKQVNGKQETGTCKETKTTCEELAKEPLEGNLNGKFESAGEEIHVLGSFNKMVFIDD